MHPPSHPTKQERSARVFAVIARFQVKPGHVDEVIDLLRQAAIPSLAESGCHSYIANQDLADSNLIVMYEQYDDADAFQRHLDSTHVKNLVAGKVVPLLESRTRETFAVVTST
jgi:(4S)-4-hydroxy-5-phosphonooxypentane-2,3-dione isomerase